ncbi:ACT domain-containing protein [Pseudoalteromonas sp. T1lg48]|uniref:ACT domain-containing protein n=1 Tax=Pseudoalteromonas sp. T1lg48 TaxID=2077100 RepID=UPI000CF73D54|nr:ACT domain-containing protein [Pseudoalteromonas sp. T1lg48]
MAKQTLQLLPHEFTIHSFDSTAAIPSIIFQSEVYFVGKTSEELSIVCNSDIELDSLAQEPGWVAFEVLGPLGFSLTGILSNISGVLARANISIFAISTFDTDYILVKRMQVTNAMNSLKKEGYNVRS